MKLLLKRIALAGAVIALGAQFFRPDRTNPAGDPTLSIRHDPQIPVSVIALMDRSCIDCHTNDTRWPWYTNITPVNFLVARDVQEGRQKLDLSGWMRLSPAKRASILERMSDEITDGEMPLAPYVLMHPEARWTDEERAAFLDWAAAMQDSLMATME